MSIEREIDSTISELVIEPVWPEESEYHQEEHLDLGRESLGAPDSSDIEIVIYHTDDAYAHEREYDDICLTSIPETIAESDSKSLRESIAIVLCDYRYEYYHEDDSDEYSSSHGRSSFFVRMETRKFGCFADESLTSNIFAETETYEESDRRREQYERDYRCEDEPREYEYEIGHRVYI